ncbi:hypothetical protein G6F58_013398 [Rhizopus delemar]|nr:hypothetical protein G6F58_013398 [Rhizopus delemar]
MGEQQIMLIVLGLIDVVMISNLLVMVIVGGYETFRAEGEAGDGDHRHLLHPPAEDLPRQWRTEWHPTVHAGADERGRRQHRDRPLLDADP